MCWEWSWARAGSKLNILVGVDTGEGEPWDITSTCLSVAWYPDALSRSLLSADCFPCLLVGYYRLLYQDLRNRFWVILGVFPAHSLQPSVGLQMGQSLAGSRWLSGTVGHPSKWLKSKCAVQSIWTARNIDKGKVLPESHDSAGRSLGTDWGFSFLCWTRGKCLFGTVNPSVKHAWFNTCVTAFLIPCQKASSFRLCPFWPYSIWGSRAFLSSVLLL